MLSGPHFNCKLDCWMPCVARALDMDDLGAELYLYRLGWHRGEVLHLPCDTWLGSKGSTNSRHHEALIKAEEVTKMGSVNSGSIASSGADDGAKLSARLDLLDLLPNGTIRLPAGTERIFLEVGSNSENTFQNEELELFPDAFLITFEPLLHQYSKVLSSNTVPGVLQSLGSYSPQAIALPFAVSQNDSAVELVIGGSDDFCASLLSPLHARARPGCADASGQIYRRQVPSVSLKTVLGNWLAWKERGTGWQVDYVKIDAQGLDVEVLRSAGELMPRILRVLLEVPGDACERMYNGSWHCSEIVSKMKHFGYLPAYNRSCADFGNACYEDDIEFLREGVQPLHHKLLPFGQDCWNEFKFAVDTGELPVDYCCRNLGLGAKRGCWNSLYRASRCCAHRWQPNGE
eukprot:TRINITY_DN111396_c0_g1_i1.p1 TRINITY_DN111396_c0_g1~~TRINITY_DN111396_c0_g1_i1.p1  ORF type:complete len:450 (+),score=59.94 TRINITY_DN111396_c0_g1_i1:143-1351(+)